MHDYQLQIYNWTSRTNAPGWNGNPSTFETIPITNRPPSSGKAYTFKVSFAWMDFIKLLNPLSWEKFTKRGVAWINSAYSAESRWPAESLTFGGNVVSILNYQKGCWQIETFDNNTLPLSLPNQASLNYQRKPHLFHQHTVITSANKITKGGSGYDAIIPMLRRDTTGQLFLPESRLEFFPTLPRVTTMLKNAPVFNGANKRIGLVAIGQEVNIVSYAPHGSSVMGKTSGLPIDGWIYLLDYRTPSTITYNSDWTMNTLPPPPVAV